MQGRLLPPFEGRFQAFPAVGWREEFARARAAGLACIEWIYEKPHENDNPLRDAAGIDEIRRCGNAAGIAVRSICADYYMTDPLVGADDLPHPENCAHLRWLIGQAARLSVAYIVLPFVDASSLRTPARIAAAADAIRGVLPAARNAGIELHIECDLPPRAFRAFIDEIADPLVKANYDIGNSASLGYDPAEELTLLAPHLGSVHVKDRLRGGGTVALGTGNADFPTCFRLIRRAGFSRWLVLQAARADAGDEIALASTNRRLVERLWQDVS